MKKSAGYASISVPEDRLDDFFDVVQWAFVGEWWREDRDDYVAALPVDRARAVEVTDERNGKPGTLAGVHASFGTEMVVPGGRRVSTAGLSWLGVHPAHRRRGLMTTMIHDHFERCLARGEHVSVLYAMESEIYARFGYGMGSETVKAEIPRGPRMWKVDGVDELTVRLERADFDKHDQLVADLQAKLDRPGTVLNPVGSGRNARFTDPVGNRKGMEKWRLLIVEDAGEPVAYAFFRRKADSSVGIHDGIAQIAEHGSLSAAASQRMWQVLTDFDLVGTTTTANLATDDPLLLQLKNARAAGGRVIDNLWVRLLDVPAALEARGYYADADVTIALADKHVPTNTGLWSVRIAGGEAQVTRAEEGATPDLTMDVRHLGASYLGGTSLQAIARAGLIEENRPGAALALSAAMDSPIAPLANWDF